jgi:crotonobetainyl-CoA:carnitine CoA-transferase CaiB-like acyl-CoA transferase
VGTYFCQDGKGIVLMMLQAERFWPLFAATVGRGDLLERYPTAAARFEHAAAIRADLVAFFATRPRSDWEDLLRPSECIWGPFQTPADLAGDPQVQANGFLLEAETADGTVTLCANPVQFGGEPPVVRSAACDAGAHTEEVLLEHGCSWDELARWKDAGVIA